MLGRRCVVSWWRADSSNPRKPKPRYFRWAATLSCLGHQSTAHSRRVSVFLRRTSQQWNRGLRTPRGILAAQDSYRVFCRQCALLRDRPTRLQSGDRVSAQLLGRVLAKPHSTEATLQTVSHCRRIDSPTELSCAPTPTLSDDKDSRRNDTRPGRVVETASALKRAFSRRIQV